MKNEKSRLRYYLTALAGVVVGVLLDQFTKYLAITRLKDGEPYIILENIFQLEYLENRGAAFGLFQNQRLFFFLSVIFICIAVIWFYGRVPMEKHYRPLRICAVFIVAGAFGNFIDRVRLEYVVDFFYFKLIDFPIFNIADIYVTVSTAVLIFFLCFYYKEEDLERIFHSRRRGG